jgi:cytochrome c5
MTDRGFFKYFMGLVGSLAALAVVLFAVSQVIATKPEPQDAAAVAERIKPVGGATPPAGVPVSKENTKAGVPVPATSVADGKTVYNTVCQVCHAAGLAGAPKFGDKKLWAPRIAQGTAVLYSHAINGYQGKTGIMIPKGGYAGPDADVKAAVDYMVNAAR